MSIEKLEHLTIRVSDLDDSIRFYTDVLGLRNGGRPPFSFPGAWLYAGDVPVVHLVAERAFDAAAQNAVDHIGFVGTDPDGTLARLKAQDVEYETRKVPLLGSLQVFLTDPNGVRIEVNFPHAVSAAW